MGKQSIGNFCTNFSEIFINSKNIDGVINKKPCNYDKINDDGYPVAGRSRDLVRWSAMPC